MAGVFALWYPTVLMLKVQWPAVSASHAEVWRVLDLSGMTKSVRESKLYTRSGYVFLNGAPITMKSTVGLGDLFNLEVRLPDGRRFRRQIMLVERPYWNGQNQRVPFEEHRHGRNR